MICGLMDDIKTSVLIGFVLLFSAIIIYYLHERIVYLEHSVSKQNEVLSDFISNVQSQVCGAPPQHALDARDNIKIISQMDINPFDKIVISDDEDDDDSDSDSDDDSDESDTDDEDDEDDEDDRKIKVIELVDSEKDKDKENEMNDDLKEMNDDDLSSSSSENVKKIDLSHKDKDDGSASSFAADVDLKKLSVGELRNLIVSKGSVSTQNALKMKKQELIEALLHKQ
jgi:hypothetical protein